MSLARREKRFFRKSGMSHPVYEAWNLGQAAVLDGCLPPRLRTNPYPPGRRHDEWQRGHDTADPMGDWHGRNV